MRRLLTIGCLIGAVCLPAPGEAAPARYSIGPEHLSIGLLVEHLGYHNVRGQFLEVGGSFVFDEEAWILRGLKVTIDAANFFSNHKARDVHVAGEDFLNAAQHPTITFVGTKAEPTGESTGKITGDLTILGVTRPVTLNKLGLYPWVDNYVAGISGRTAVKRSEFGMMYGVEGGLPATRSR